MSVINGGINIAVRVDGVGAAPAKVKETKEEIDKLKRSADGASVSVAKIKEKVGAMKDGLGPLNLIREGFNFLREQAGFVTLAVGAVTATISGLAELLSSDDSIDDYAQGMIDSARATLELSKQIAQVSVEAKKAARDLTALRQATLKSRADTARSRGDDDQADAIDRQARVESIQADRGKVYKDGQEAWKQLRLAEGQARDLTDAIKRDRADLAELEARFEGRVAGTSGKQWGDFTGIQAKRVGLIAAEATMKAVSENIESLRGTYQGLVEQGKALDAAAEEAIVIKMPEIQVVDPRSGGRGVRRRRMTQEEIDELLGGPTNGDELLALRKQQQDMWGIGATSKDLGSGGAANDNSSMSRDGSMPRKLAADVRDFAGALSEALPGMDAFAGALSQISQLWGEYAETGKGAARATIMSVGAIAMAGAEQIKNERLKAGVLSVIHLGLGTALMFVPGAQQEALGHLAGAAILGSVAIFGSGGKGAGGGSRSSSRSVARPLSDRTESGAWTVNIFGGWFGTSSPQETAAALHALTRRGGGSGYVPTERAA